MDKRRIQLPSFLSAPAVMAAHWQTRDCSAVLSTTRRHWQFTDCQWVVVTVTCQWLPYLCPSPATPTLPGAKLCYQEALDWRKWTRGRCSFLLFRVKLSALAQFWSPLSCHGRWLVWNQWKAGRESAWGKGRCWLSFKFSLHYCSEDSLALLSWALSLLRGWPGWLPLPSESGAAAPSLSAWVWDSGLGSLAKTCCSRVLLAWVRVRVFPGRTEPARLRRSGLPGTDSDSASDLEAHQLEYCLCQSEWLSW